MKINDIIVETKVEGHSYEHKKLEIAKAVELLNKHCREALALVKKPIWRGMSNKEKIAYFDTTNSIRKSTNTSNHYTELIDNNPLYQGWPKRSNSFICSSSIATADGFGHYIKNDYDAIVYAMFPFDGTRIAICPGDDMWNTIVDLPAIGERKIGIEGLNAVLIHEFGLRDNFKEMQMQIKNDKEVRQNILDASNNKMQPEQFIPYLFQQMAPEKLKFQLKTIGEYAANPPYDRELWISGKFIGIRRDLWKDFQSAFKAQSKLNQEK